MPDTSKIDIADLWNFFLIIII